MLRITGSVDTGALTQIMSRWERRVASATRAAASKVASSAATKVAAEIAGRFDRPTPFALRAVAAKPATKSDPVADVRLRKGRGSNARDPQAAASYLWPQVRGGRRQPKGFENALQRVGVLPSGWLAVPSTAAPLDAYGNYPAPQIVRILAYFQALRSRGGRSMNTSAERIAKLRAGGRKAPGFEMFVMKPGANWPSGQAAQPGIYMRILGIGGKGGNAVVPLFVFVRAASYRPRLPFKDLVAQVRDRELQGHFDRELARISD